MMQLLRRALLLLFGLMYALPSNGVASINHSNYAFNHVLQSKIEAIGYINAIAQDATGFMWFGGSNGLARYDGYALKLYRYDEHQRGSLSHNYVYSLLLDRSGRFWVGTREGLNLYNPDTDTFSVFRQPNSTPTANTGDDIRCLFEDSENRLWLGTRGGLYSFDRKNQAYHRYQIKNSNRPANTVDIVWSIAEDQRGSLWVGNHTSGVSRLDLASNEFRHYTDYTGGKTNNPSNDIRRIFVDSSNNVWAGTYGGGIRRLNRALDAFEPFEHEPNRSEKSRIIWDFAEDADGSLWIGDGSAVSVINSTTGEISRHNHNSLSASSPGNYVANRLFVDRTNNIWVGYFPSGIDLVDQQAAVFLNFSHNSDDPATVSDGGILAATEDSHGNLWIGAGYGLNYFDRTDNTIKRTHYNPDNPQGISGNTVLSVLEDQQQTLWLGIWSGGLNRRDANTNTFKHYMPEEGNPRSLLGKEPWALLQDSQQRLWVATDAGLNRYHPETDDFTHYLPQPAQMDDDITLYTRALLEDHAGRIWVGSIHGLYLFEPDSGRFTRYHANPKDPYSINNDYVIALYQDSKQHIWVGTHGGGLNLFEPETGKFTHFTTDQGLANDVITSIVEDSDGNLWLSSQQGLSRFDIHTHNILNRTKSHGLSGNLFNRNTGLRLRDGNLFFGNSLGFVLFDPRRIELNQYQPPVVFTGFRLFNQPITQRQDSNILTQSIEQTKSIQVQHDQTMLTLEYAALNYQYPEKNHYAYKLEGFDQDWIYVGNQRQATYTNLDSGQYRLHVKAANNDGIWNNEGATIAIEVLPPLWQTRWAYIVYALLLCILCCAGLVVFLSRRANDQKGIFVARMRELDTLKREFLDNTAHKLRTPLYSMVGLSETLLYKFNATLNDEAKDNLNMIAASGKRLSGLVNELIDYTELCDKTLKLDFQPVNLYILTELVFSLVAPMAQTKPIRLVNALSPNITRVMADEKRLQQVLLNLVENAVQCTREGFVTVSAEVSASRVRVSVEDSGIGIAPQRLKNIFEPFQRNNDPTETQGNSLGLAISLKLVQMQGSTIDVKSTVGVGSEFSFDLPITHQDLQPGSMFLYTDQRTHKVDTESKLRLEATLAAELASRTLIRPKYRTEDRHKRLASPADAHNYRVLIVDDDNANRIVISAMLHSHNYQVAEAESGADAIALIEAEQTPVDLVLMDAIMPKMNGFEACEIIRQQRDIHALPIIFVSASNRERDIAAAYAVGASDYLSKPVTISELIAKINIHLHLVAKFKGQ